MSTGDNKEHGLQPGASPNDINIEVMTKLLSQITQQVEEMKKLRQLMQSKDSKIANLDIVTEELLNKLKEANEAYALSNEVQTLRLENQELRRQIKKMEDETKREK